MNKQFLIEQLNNIENAKRVNRLRVSNLVLKNPEIFPFLLDIVFDISDKTSIKAAWVLEFVCKEKLEWLTPYLDYFTENIGSIKQDSAVRPISKICEFIAKAYFSKNNSIVKDMLTKEHLDSIIETGFDWLISQHKVAVKAYTMTTLFLLGKNYDWVHQELKLIIQQNITKETAAYKARGNLTLALINKK